MFTINENRIDPQVTESSKDMTQRIPLDGTAPAVQRPVNPQRRKKKRWFMTKKEKITLITLGAVTAALLIAALAAEGKSVIAGGEHIIRGYENIAGVFSALGADIVKK